MRFRAKSFVIFEEKVRYRNWAFM